MKYTTIYNDPNTRAIITNPWCYWDDGFTEEEIAKIIEYCDNKELKTGEIFGGVDEEIRKSQIGFHNRTPEIGWIFDRCNFIIQSINEMYYGFDLNGYNYFQYTVYNAEEQGNYDWHMDMLMSGANSDPQPRKLSMTLLLNDDFEGGEFQINLGNQNKSETLPAKKGRALLFPSFMLHRVSPVTKGFRKSLVIWCLGPKFQ